MACAVAALKADGEVIIEEAEAINKSYPEFYSHLQNLGAFIINSDFPLANPKLQTPNLKQ
jgi:UDP-N-acetylglucosamine enolpyruvyl transferase